MVAKGAQRVPPNPSGPVPAGLAVLHGPLKRWASQGLSSECATEVWSTSEREQFISFIAANPEAGDLIRGSGGCRKVRWSTSGQGKSGGA